MNYLSLSGFTNMKYTKRLRENSINCNNYTKTVSSTDHRLFARQVSSIIGIIFTLYVSILCRVLITLY